MDYLFQVVTISEPSGKHAPATSVKPSPQTVPVPLTNEVRLLVFIMILNSVLIAYNSLYLFLIQQSFNKSEWAGAIKKVAERLFVDPTNIDSTQALPHTQQGESSNDKTSAINSLSYAERLQVMIMQVRQHGEDINFDE